MREQLRRLGMPASSVIGIDEISIKKGSGYRLCEMYKSRGQQNGGGFYQQVLIATVSQNSKTRVIIGPDKAVVQQAVFQKCLETAKFQRTYDTVVL